MASLDYLRVDYPEPHLARTRELLAAHPEVTRLFGNVPATSLFVFGIVGLQLVMAWALRDSPWWVLLLAAYSVGALANHALWTLIHDCTHNLVFKSSWANSWLQIFANLPIVVPSAISFRKFHLLHHRFQGDPELDADLASPIEVRVVGNTVFGKAFWLLFFFAFQALRVPRLKKVQLVDRWFIANWAVQLVFIASVWLLLGPRSLVYLGLACVFSIGLHPVGARWIQEHYILHAPQETYSYYGPMNLLAFNVGYHNEHHDLMRVPWSRLPRVRAMAPEFYDGLISHRSWTALLFKFLFDPKLSLASRVVRDGVRAKRAEPVASEPRRATG